LYYITANLVRRILKTVKCVPCRDALLNSDNRANLPESILTDYLERGIHPNTHFYRFILYLEERFAVHCNSPQIYESILDDVYRYEKLSFPCSVHSGEMLLHVIQYYVSMCMQQYCSQLNAGLQKDNQLKKKVAKHCAT